MRIRARVIRKERFQTLSCLVLSVRTDAVEDAVRAVGAAFGTPIVGDRVEFSSSRTWLLTADGWQESDSKSNLTTDNEDNVGKDTEVIAKLIGTDLASADLAGADLHGADLSRADLESANLNGADLCRANLESANLSRASLENTSLLGAGLVGANLRAADLWHADLTSADLTSADLSASSLRYADLHGANLTGANLTGADVAHTSLAGANLSDADLRRANFWFANLTGVNLTGAILTGADFRDADLTGANLTGTCLDPAAAVPQTDLSGLGEADADGFITCYRTKRSLLFSSTVYEPGRVYTAPVFSVDTETECHPGLYVAPLDWLREAFPREKLVKVRVSVSDTIRTVGGKYRTRRMEVIEDVE